ncbi:Pectinesterase inhibitor 11 [Cardamine amara subsp. amara]|uniref:Pectinesterase inhibitor 11 n=1 Tax=Cardamine amara subsp. amara TaxID=228776 RepID=A0ABD1BQL4_CARAN
MVGQSHTTTFIFFTTFLFISRSISAVHFPSRPNTTITNDLDFIRTSCNATLYPDVCFTSLAGYASAVQDSPARLAKLAIGVSLSQAKSTAAYLSKLSRSAVVTSTAKYSGDGHQTTSAVIRDCISNVEDAVDEMRGSLRQLRNMNGGGGVAAARRSVETFRFQMSNVQTWMSAALTDEDTCMDGFEDLEEGGVIKTTVCDRLEEVKRLTSNALALVNTYANNGAP